MRPTNDNSRRGFTLIELLVVMALLLVLLGLTIAFVPRFQENQRVSQGASTVQSALMIAKQRALRDRSPRGVRLQPGTNNALWVTDLQYIEQPEDFSGGTAETASDNATVVTFQGVDLTGGSSDPTLWDVQPGDYLEIRGGGLIRRIIPPMAPKQIILEAPTPGMPTFHRVAPTKNYRIIRAPRVAGDDPVQLPGSVAIDLTPDTMVPPRKKPEYHPILTPQAPYFDILFAPSGAVIGPAAAYDKIILWVRDISLTGITEGEPTLICIYTRSGAIAAHPVDIQGGNYYTFTEDGRSSGQ
jgi:prepilin-type N-terminal cleavage/methylation domain-containing protein